MAFSKLSLRDKKGALAFKALIEAAGFKNASFEMDAIYTKNFRGTDLGKHRLTIPSTVRWLKGDFALKFSWQKASYDSPSFAEELDNNADFQPTLKLRQ